MSYKPEYSWNYELGGHFSCMDGAVRGDFALFYIDVRDQQITVFPEGQTTGRMMTNAGRTRSLGAEAALQVSPWRQLDINLAYGYTDARFVKYETTVKDDAGTPVRISYKDNRIPYAPQHTLSANAAWTVATGVTWLGDVVLQTGVRCAGRIWWNEENSLFAAVLRPRGRLRTVRTQALFARHLGPQPRRNALRRLLFQVDRQRVRPARTPPDFRHHPEYKHIKK